MNSPEATSRSLRLSAWWIAVSLLLLGVVYVRALAFTPVEATQGPAQKIFYIHVPSAWVAFLAFGLVGLCGALYLFLKDLRLDRFAACCAEVGVVFTTGVLVTGPIWGKPVWGTWWTWDARLTSTLFLWFIYVGYLVLRTAVEEAERRARYAAALGIFGALLVPFVHVSVLMFRTLHPRPVVLNPEGPTLPGSMLATLMFSLGVFSLLFLSLVAHRYAQLRLRDARALAEADRPDAS
jgi:heme exporter protein C